MSRRIAAVAAALLLAACSVLEPRPDPTRHFVLASSPASALAAGAIDASLPPLGVGPITVPEYLQRNELVRRTAEHEVAPSRVERWAEPLEAGVARVLAEDLSLFCGREVARHPWSATDAPRVQVGVELLRFEPVEGGHVELVANLRLVDLGKQTSSQQHHEIAVALRSDDGNGVAAAMSEALFELAKAMAAAAAALARS